MHHKAALTSSSLVPHAVPIGHCPNSGPLTPVPYGPWGWRRRVARGWGGVGLRYREQGLGRGGGCGGVGLCRVWVVYGCVVVV